MMSCLYGIGTVPAVTDAWICSNEIGHRYGDVLGGCGAAGIGGRRTGRIRARLDCRRP
jgi:hypothetical protein